MTPVANERKKAGKETPVVKNEQRREAGPRRPMPKMLFGVALLITLFLLMILFVVSDKVADERENYIEGEMRRIYQSLSEFQTFFLLSEIFGDEMACLAFQTKIRELDRTIWDLGRKIDQYRVATEEFQKDPFYLEQKRIFNENEVLYLALVTKLNKQCGFEQGIISYFYSNSADCPKCDDQSFILTDISRELNYQVSIFSFDMDLGLTSLGLLSDYYDVTHYPCIVIDDKAFCGLRSRQFILERVCESSPQLPYCAPNE